MSDTALMVRDDAHLSVKFTEEAELLKSSALETAALIGRVSNSDENAAAANAQTEIKRVLKLTEDSRKAHKSPVLDYGSRIDAAAKRFIAELKEEEMRIATLVGNFQQLELAKARAAEAARLKEIAEIERKKQEELAAAKSLEEMEKIQERSNQEAAALPVVKIAKAAGQVVREEWDIQIVDAWALARAHPACVTITPRLSDIKAILDAGITPAGVYAKKVVKSGVRLGREPAVIET